MSQSQDNARPIRRLVLRSGRAIEVLGPATGAGLHVCRECKRELVYPHGIEKISPVLFELVLRCPNCEWAGTGVFDWATVDRLNREVDRGLSAIAHDLDCLTRANMDEQLERFAGALEADAILPEDF